MPVAKSFALATVLILELSTLVDAAPRSQSGTAVRYRLKAAVAIAQIHVLVSLRRSRTSTDPVTEAPILTDVLSCGIGWASSDE